MRDDGVVGLQLINEQQHDRCPSSYDPPPLELQLPAIISPSLSHVQFSRQNEFIVFAFPCQPARVTINSRVVQISTADACLRSSAMRRFFQVLSCSVSARCNLTRGVARFGIRDGVLHATVTTCHASSESSGSGLIFSIGGGRDRVEAALSHAAGGGVCSDRLFAAEKAREERCIAGGSLAVVQENMSQATSRVQVWVLGERGCALCEVVAIDGRIVDWVSFLGGTPWRGGVAAAESCWLICVHSSGGASYLNLSPAAGAAAASATSSNDTPQLIKGLNFAAKLQAMPSNHKLT